MSDAGAALREIAAINLRYALAETLTDGGGPGLVRALEHVREAEAFLQILLMDSGDRATEPNVAMAPD